MHLVQFSSFIMRNETIKWLFFPSACAVGADRYRVESRGQSVHVCFHCWPCKHEITTWTTIRQEAHTISACHCASEAMYRSVSIGGPFTDLYTGQDQTSIKACLSFHCHLQWCEASEVYVAQLVCETRTDYDSFLRTCRSASAKIHEVQPAVLWICLWKIKQ